MRQRFFFALLCLLVAPELFSQKNLPPSLLPYASNWGRSTVNALHRVGFEVPIWSEKSTAALELGLHTNMLVLDSTKTFYGYGVPSPTDSTPIFRSTYQYPAVNVKIETNEQYENSVWLPINRSTFTLDAQGRIEVVYAEAFVTTAQDYRPDSRLRVFPHGNSSTLIDSFFVQQWDTLAQAWSQIIANRNVFDVDDRLLESYSLLNLFGQEVNFKEVYRYDANGDNTRVESYALFNGLEILTAKIEIAYDNHLPTETVAFVVGDNDVFVPQSRVTRIFTAFGAEQQVESYEYDFGDDTWLQTETINYTYDIEQRVQAKETIFLHEGEPEEREKVVYDYILNEMLRTESYYLWVPGFEYQLSDRRFYYYRSESSASPEPFSPILPLRILPNPTIGKVNLELNSAAFIQIYTTQGDMVSSGLYHPATPLLLSDLPSGLYFITARTESKVYSGRVVKH